MLSAIIGIGFLHRLLFLNTRQLWTDELMQGLIIQNATPLQILSRLQRGMDLASPLDFLFQKGITSLFGQSNWAMRLHAVLFGTIAIWFFYRVATFLFDHRVAVFSSLLFAFFPLAVHYSQEARPYSLLLMLSIASYDLTLRQLFGNPRKRRQSWILMVMIDVLLLYTSYLGALVLLSQFAAIMISFWKSGIALQSDVVLPDPEVKFGSISKSNLLGWCLGAGVASLAFVPWIIYTFERPLLTPVSAILDPKLPLRLVKEFGDNSYLIAALLLTGMIFGVCTLMRNGQRNKLSWLVIWLIVPIPVLLLIEAWFGYFFAIRHLLYATPPAILLCGYGLTAWNRKVASAEKGHIRFRPAAIAATLLITGSLWIGYSHTHGIHADWSGTAAFLNRNVKSGDAVSMPMVSSLLGFHAPRLLSFDSKDLDPGVGSLRMPNIRRRVVVCYEGLYPNPCAEFKEEAQRNHAWTRYQLKGFDVFTRSR